jgi:GAF domain-containing protein
MTAVSEDATADLNRRIAELEQRLELALIERDAAIERQTASALVNFRLQSELRAATERQNAAAEILRTIAGASGDADRSLQQIAEASARLFGAPSVTILLADGEDWGKTINFGASSERVRARVADERPRFGGDNLPGMVFREGRQIHIPDLDNIDPAMAHWPVMAARAEGTRTVAATPLRHEGKPIGVLIVYRDRLAAFTDEELALLQTFADQAVIAIENARLFNETQEALERQTATAEILKVIASSPSDVQPVFDAIAERSNQLVNGLSTSVLSLVDDALHMVAYTKVSPAADAALRAYYPQPLSTFPWGETVRRGEIIRIPDSEEEAAVREVARARGWRSATLVPLLRDQKPIGMISVTRRETGLFADHDVKLLQTFADQAVIAIENTRLFNETREALERQTATAEILKVIASSPADVQPVFEAIATSANRLIGGFSAAVHRVIDDIVHLVAFTPTNPEADEALKAAFPVHLSQMPSVALVQNGETAQVADAETADPQTQGLSRARGWRSVTFTPLMNQGACIGFIACTRREAGVLADHHVQLLRTFADQAVIAIENTRLFNEVQARTHELTEALEQQIATSEVLSVISSSAGDLAPVFDAMLAKAMQLCGANFGVLNTYDGTRFQTAATYGLRQAYDEYRRREPLEYGPGTAPARLLEGEPFVEIDDLLGSEAYRSGDPNRRALVDVGGARSLLAVPLLKDERVVGNVMIFRQEQRTFSQKQTALLQQFAAQAVIAIENTRLLRELRQSTEDLSESLQQQTATAEVLKVISRSAFDLDAVMNTLARSAAELCGAGLSALHLRDGDLLVAKGIADQDGRFIEFMRQNPLPITDQTYSGRAVLTGAIVNIADAEHDQASPLLRKFQSVLGYKSMLLVPLMREGRGIGLFSLTRNRAGEFSPREVELVQTFADQAVIAIENARLFDEVQARTRDLAESLQQQTAMSEVLQIISSSPSELAPVFEKMLENATRVCGAEFGSMMLIEDGSARQAALYNAPAALAAARTGKVFRPPPQGLMATVIQTKQAAQVADMRTTPGYLERHQTTLELVDLAGARTVAVVPMLREGDVIGTITIYRQEVRPFGDKQIDLLTNFARQAVIAIENARLLRELRQRTDDLSEALTYQTGSANILSVIASSPTDVEPVLMAIVKSACELCDAYDAVVLLKDGDDLRVSAHHGPIPISFSTHQINRKWTAGRAFVDKKAVHVHDLQAEHDEFPDGQELAAQMGHHTIVSVPLLREGDSIGALVLRRTEIHPFSDKQIALLQTFADQAVIAIGNVRLFDEVQARTRELANSLHDLRTAQNRLIQTEKLASLGQLTAGIAHEIKNPLNFVNNFAALSAELTDELRDALEPAVLDETIRAEVDELTGTLKDNLGKVVQHGKRADSIVKNMLLHSREGSGEHRPADVNALVDESLNLAYHGARAEKPQFNVTLQRDFDPDAGTMEVFPQEITRVLLNLISNGFYAVNKRKADNGGADFEPLVIATTRGAADHVEIRIRDNGTGIPPEVREKMFNPFFTTKPAGEGTGLGLSMSHDIVVKQHGGTIDVETEPGAFTEFRLVLPRSSLSRKAAGN